MNDIKKILENHKQAPNNSTWDRISANLDKTMPLFSEKGRKNVILWTSAAVFAIFLTSGIAFFAANKPTKNENLAQNTEITKEPAAENITEETIVSKEAAEVANVAEENDKTAVEKKSAPKSEVSKNQVNTETEKRSNVKQIVIPANSTLARQLQNDPVLKNLSGEEIAYEPPVSLQIPNLFTPNGDGVNDYFVIEGLENYEKKMLTVRDRSGKTVFSSANYRNNWDGGKCPEGNYSYELTFSYNGIENIASGKVRIIRN